jgi:hypothetical protein
VRWADTEQDQVVVIWRELKRAQLVQYGRGGVKPTELECVVCRIDKRDDIMRKDDDVIQKMRGRHIDLKGKHKIDMQTGTSPLTVMTD